jgi:NAD(P)-dependent dehydrogenase (short-subunit alcohol dehydrogenase family)
MFKDKVIVITGSTQGIGLRTAEILATKGAKIVINSRSSEKVEKAINRLLTITTNVIGVVGDVSNYDFCVQLKNQTINQFGKVDVLINIAGMAAKGELSETEAKVYELIFSVNILGSLHPTMAFLPELKKQKGSVLFISSVAGVIGLPSYSAYSASKRAIVSLAESFKNELVDDQIFVGVNYPGFTENDAQKIVVDAKGNEISLKKRIEVKATPLDQTVMCIINQISKKKFRAYSSANGRVVQLIYRIMPSLALTVIKLNRNKIRSMQ